MIKKCIIKTKDSKLLKGDKCEITYSRKLFVNDHTDGYWYVSAKNLRTGLEVFVRACRFDMTEEELKELESKED